MKKIPLQFLLNLLNSNYIIAFIILCPTLSLAQIQHDLLLDLDFENGIADSSSENQTTIVSGAGSYATDKYGNANACMQFYGSSNNGAVFLTDDVNGTYKMNFPASFSAWVKIASFSTISSPILTTEDHGSAYSGFWIEVTPTGAVRAHFGSGFGTNASTDKKTFETATGLINLNKWHHIAVVFKSANEATIYVDGFAKPTTVFGSASNCYYYRVVGTAGKIGGFVKGTGNRTLDGMVDKVKFFGTALTQSEIFALSYVKHNNMSSLLFNYNMNNNYNDTSIYQQITDLATTSCQYGPDKLSYANAVLNVSPTSAIEIREAAGNFKCNFPMTFSSWIKLNSLGSINPIFTNDDNLGTYTGVWIQILANGTIGVNIGDGVSVGPFSRRSYVTTNALSVDSQWRHLAVVLKSAPSPALYTTEIYVDGVLWPVGAQSGSGGQLAYYTGNGNWARIGCYYKGGNVLSTLSGSMDGVMFWNDSLTSDEINNIVDNYYTGCLTLPTIEAIASVDTICYGTTVTLNGSGGNTYTWSGGITDGVAFLPSATTTYIVNGTDVNSCTNTDSISITVNQLPAITVNVSSDSVCKGTSVTLQGAGANSYVWSGNINDNVPFVPTATTTYTLIATDVNMCSDTVTTTIVVNNLPDTTISLFGNIITATTIAEALYQWVDCGNGYTPIPSETNQSFTATVNGSYAVIVTSNGCSDTSSCVSVSSVAVSENENATIYFYPNPSSGLISIVNKRLEEKTILYVEDYTGKIIYSTQFSGEKEKLDLGFLANGLYFLKLKNTKEISKHKLLISK